MCFFPTPRRLNYSSWELGTCKKKQKKTDRNYSCLVKAVNIPYVSGCCSGFNSFSKTNSKIKSSSQNLRFMQIYLTPPIQKLPGHSFFTSFAFHPKPFLEKRPPSTGARSPATAHLYAGKNYVAENPIPIYKTITMNTTVTTNLQLLQLLEQYLKKAVCWGMLGRYLLFTSFYMLFLRKRGTSFCI